MNFAIMKIFKAFKKKLILFVLCLSSLFTRAQISQSEVKAALILHFCENVTWQNELPDTLRIGCFVKDNELYNFLKPAEQNIEIQKRKLKIQKLKNLSNIQGLHSIYYDGNRPDELMELFNYAKNNNILLITDNITDELFVLISFIDKPEKVEFKVNMPNLNLSGFAIKPNLLLNGGSVVDINLAYKNFEERIQNSKRDLDKYEKELLISQNQIKQKDSLLEEKEKQQNEYINNIDKLQIQSDQLKKILNTEREQIEVQQNELKKSYHILDTLKNNIEQKEKEYNKAKTNLELLEKEAENLKSEISTKDLILSENEALISSQRRILFLILALALALIIFGITLYRLFILKKKHNVILSHKVEERTKELKLSNMQYQSLFNLAPVALWETDFSEVKKYIKSHVKNKNGNFDNLVANNKNFTIECIRRIRFINLNKSALDLFKINNKDELIDIYEQLHAEGELKELIPELKLIYLEKTSNTFESVRKNKDGKQIELIVTWIDISETHGTFNRVLLSLIDITHLRKIERELKKHQNELELLVQEKTENLETANEELQSSNEELFEKNKIINDQNNELKITLEHLKETQAQLLQSEKMASLGVLTAGVAHEINNPLNYISGAYQGFIDIIGDSPDERIVLLLDALNTGIERVSSIVKSLNQFSRTNNASDEKCNIHEIIDNCLVMLQNKTKHRVEVRKEFTSNSAKVLGNVGGLHQVFLNVLSNAEQSIENNGEILVKTSLIENNIVIEIIDNGIGITEENLTKITDPFYTTKDPGEGTGLGLSITYNIIRSHGGTIEFNSELNKGTTVKITLPINNN